MKLNIITRCTRTQNLNSVSKSIFNKSNFQIIWHVAFDTHVLKDIDAEILSDIQSNGGLCYFIKGIDGDFGHDIINQILSQIDDGFVFVLDDDNIIHEDFYEELYRSIISNPHKLGFVYNQRIDGKDFTGQEIRYCDPSKMKVSQVDMAQVVLHITLIANIRLCNMNYIADSIFIEKVYNSLPDSFLFINKILCYYNYLKLERKANVPKVLYIGDNEPVIKSDKKAWWESDDMNVSYSKNILIDDVVKFDPDVIVTTTDSSLSNYNTDIKKRWININKNNPNLGEISYNSSMNYILENNNKSLISFFTPIYNISDKLVRLYDSIRNQTHTNWEWVLVNDSTDNGKTLKIAESISKSDHRVKVYDFREKSKGVIGESKYRAAMLCRGYLLAEIDHDDYIMPDSAKVLFEAFDQFPDAGFAYTDCVEITEDWKTLRYGDGFCFGYGKYRTEKHMGIDMDVNESPNINPKTIRHIVGIPNHIRCWKRDTYLKLGGHNRRLSVADDYELVVRTFLETRFIRIVKNCYLQFIYKSDTSSNTHELSRADIQRRVRSILDFYNTKINKRFIELGVNDWAYDENPNNPLLSHSRHGVEECAVNYSYYPDSEMNLGL